MISLCYTKNHPTEKSGTVGRLKNSPKRAMLKYSSMYSAMWRARPTLLLAAENKGRRDIFPDDGGFFDGGKGLV